MANGDGNAQIITQMLGGIGFQIIRAGDHIALFLEHLRQAAHAAAANANHVDMLALTIANMGYGHAIHPFPIAWAEPCLQIQPMILYAGKVRIINRQKGRSKTLPRIFLFLGYDRLKNFHLFIKILLPNWYSLCIILPLRA